MRPLRNSVGEMFIVLVVAVVVAATAIAGEQTTVPGPVPEVENPYFPLAVGNSWTYRCSVEGRHQFDKTLRLTATIINDNVRYFRAELQIKRDPRPLVYYLMADREGNVFRSPKPNNEERELLITTAPKVGDRLGDRKVAAIERMSVPARAQVDALRVENFSLEDPKLPAEKRAEWQAHFYARGIGQVAEADGLGGECALSKFHLVKPR